MHINHRQFRAIERLVEKTVNPAGTEKQTVKSWRIEIEEDVDPKAISVKNTTLTVRIDNYKESYYIDYKGQITTWRKVKV